MTQMTFLNRWVDVFETWAFDCGWEKDSKGHRKSLSRRHFWINRWFSADQPLLLRDPIINLNLGFKISNVQVKPQLLVVEILSGQAPTFGEIPISSWSVSMWPRWVFYSSPDIDVGQLSRPKWDFVKSQIVGSGFLITLCPIQMWIGLVRSDFAFVKVKSHVYGLIFLICMGWLLQHTTVHCWYWSSCIPQEAHPNH